METLGQVAFRYLIQPICHNFHGLAHAGRYPAADDKSDNARKNNHRHADITDKTYFLYNIILRNQTAHHDSCLSYGRIKVQVRASVVLHVLAAHFRCSYALCKKFLIGKNRFRAFGFHALPFPLDTDDFPSVRRNHSFDAVFAKIHFIQHLFHGFHRNVQNQKRIRF